MISQYHVDCQLVFNYKHVATTSCYSRLWAEVGKLSELRSVEAESAGQHLKEK